MGRRGRIRRYYERRLLTRRQHFAVLDWADAASQQARFQVLADNVPLAGKSLLDVGCGLGDLWAFLKSRSIPTAYLGVDLVEKMAASAARLHPDGEFLCADVFADHAFDQRRFDVVFASGAFNLDLGNNMEFLPVALERLLSLAREFLVFNLLHHRAPRKYEHCAYYDPGQVLSLLEPMPCQARLIDDYLPNDFTVICRK